MKQIKLEHRLAQYLRKQPQFVLWRLYDEQRLGVGDDLEIIDKNNPQDPTTWQTIGTTEVTAIAEKRLGTLTSEELSSVFGQDDISQVLTLIQREYGPQVSVETPVRIIYGGTLRPISPNTMAQDMKEVVSEVNLYTDGGSRGNPGPSASGYAILTMDNSVLARSGMYLGVTTNNQAEYQALKLGLQEAQRLQVNTVHVYMDSMLVINQMKGIFKVKNRDLWPIHDAVKSLVPQFHKVTFTHVPRELNKMADKEVNDALDLALRHSNQQITE